MKLFKNRTVLGIFCIVMSLIICFGIAPLFNSGLSQKTEIIRVVKDIRVGDQITKDMIQTVEVGGYNLPRNVIKDKSNVIDRYALMDFSPGDYILSTKLSESAASENAYLYHLDGSKQAMSITIKSFAGGLSGKLKSGDIVSVIAPDYKKQGITLIPPELKYVEVISVTAPSGFDVDQGLDNKDEKELPSTVTLLITPEQGNIFASLEAEGKTHLSLVYRGERENAEKFLNMQMLILNELYSKASQSDENGPDASDDSAPEALDDLSETQGSEEE